MSKKNIIISNINPNVSMGGNIFNSIVHQWKLNLIKRSSINFNARLDLKLLKNMKGNIEIKILMLNNKSETELNNYILNSTNNNIVNNVELNPGTYYIQFSYSETLKISYRFNLKITAIIETIPQPQPQINTQINVAKKYALIVSISDYLYISDLSYCDEDAVAWCNFLKNNNYEIFLLGDKTSTYSSHKINDYATEDNIKKYMSLISSKINKDDQFVFISSGHGSGDGKGNSFICCLDCSNNPNGQYTDKELALNIKNFTDKQAKVILFFDNCFSGGLIPELVVNSSQLVCATSTCTNNGYGFDVAAYKQGAWTYHFLIKTLLNNPTSPINDIFTKALISYPYKAGNLPQLGGNGSLKF
jgi:hypothetical protein